MKIKKVDELNEDAKADYLILIRSAKYNLSTIMKDLNAAPYKNKDTVAKLNIVSRQLDEYIKTQEE